MTGTDFSNAFLYYADFGGGTTVINGTNFGSAILTGANFAGANFEVNGGAAPDFTNALLQGATFSVDATLDQAVLLNAFVDFGAASNSNEGNNLFMQLPSNYTGYPRRKAAAQPCVMLTYGSFSAVPPNASMTCPNGNTTTCGAGDSAQSLANWRSAIAMANNSVPGWYQFDATYDKAVSNAACNGNNVDPNW